MEENTERLLRELANKIGTTGEHLWEVLIKQAPISALSDLIMAVLWITIIMWTAKFLHNKSNKWDTVIISVLWSIWGLLAIIIAMLFGFIIKNIIEALINPEYWALQQILDIIKIN